MWTRPNAAWESFAAREPFFAILTDPKFLRANLTPEHEREFFVSGETVVDWMLGVIDAALAPQFAPMSILEYGCGIGRLALPLARRPGSVTAVDASPAMLALARAEADRRGLGHVEFQTTDEFWAGERRFDLIVCYHVLQRLPREDALALARRLAGRLGADGIGVFQWPYRARVPAWTATARWARERIPGVNVAANLLKGKPPGEPFVPAHTFDVADFLPFLDGAHFGSAHIAFEHHAGLDYAVAFARNGDGASRPSAVGSRQQPALGSRQSAGEAAETEIDAFNAAAEAYFASLTGWDHHLAKPFSQIEETPAILMGVAVLLQALRLAPGMTVLEFGAGTGWLSRMLTQIGCRVYLLDVSATALRMARELFTRQPVIGGHAPPEFLEFDGRRIPLPDGSVDRIVCFDAFHHAPNPRTVIREFARVLVPGGIAGFVEPGPRHADAPRSRFESQTYGVVELDVDVHDLWRAAQASGFRDLQMCVFHGLPYMVSLGDYEDLLSGGPAQDAWAASTRTFLRHVRSFCLTKEGSVARDSRSAAGLACDIRARVVARDPLIVEAEVTNSGTASWLPSGTVPGGVSLGAHLYDAAGTLLSFDFHHEPLSNPPRPVAPGESLRCRVTLPRVEPGRYRIELDCVANGVTWFAQGGSRPAVLAFDAGSTT